MCALFIDEVLFQDIETSTGIIIDDISNDKKVGNHGRKCFFCTKMGFVVKCSCGKACDKWERLFEKIGHFFYKDLGIFFDVKLSINFEICKVFFDIYLTKR